MELRYPIILIIGIIMIVLFLFFSSKKKKSYTNGTKIANTKYLKNNKLFQKKLKKYQTVLITLKSLCIFSILISLILLARPSKVDSKRSNEYNRDIVLCMDISASVYELDADLIAAPCSYINLKLKCIFFPQIIQCVGTDYDLTSNYQELGGKTSLKACHCPELISTV